MDGAGLQARGSRLELDGANPRRECARGNRGACGTASRMAGTLRDMIRPELPQLSLLSVVIPARDEADCIASTIEHLHVELSLRGVPHEIIVVDDGSSDDTWK